MAGNTIYITGVEYRGDINVIFIFIIIIILYTVQVVLAEMVTIYAYQTDGHTKLTAPSLTLG